MTSKESSNRSSSIVRTAILKDKKLKKKKKNLKTKKQRQANKILSNEICLSAPQTSNIEQKQQKPATDNLTLSIIQGLQCNDTAILDQALNCRHENLIEKTVRSLPNSILLQLIDYLNKCLYQNAEKGLSASKWLRTLLTTHSSCLMTCPDITERLSPMYELIESHTKIYPKLARLHGKVSLISSQISNHNKELSNSDDKLSNKPPLVFEDVSDDDIEGDQTQDELIPSPSEYDDYSGLSDDLDLEIENDYNEDETEQATESDPDMNFRPDTYSNEDDDSS